MVVCLMDVLAVKTKLYSIKVKQLEFYDSGVVMERSRSYIFSKHFLLKVSFALFEFTYFASIHILCTTFF